MKTSQSGVMTEEESSDRLTGFTVSPRLAGNADGDESESFMNSPRFGTTAANGINRKASAFSTGAHKKEQDREGS